MCIRWQYYNYTERILEKNVYLDVVMYVKTLMILNTMVYVEQRQTPRHGLVHIGSEASLTQIVHYSKVMHLLQSSSDISFTRIINFSKVMLLVTVKQWHFIYLDSTLAAESCCLNSVLIFTACIKSLDLFKSALFSKFVPSCEPGFRK